MHSFYFIIYSFESHLLRSNLWLPWWLDDHLHLALSFMAESIRPHIKRRLQETGSAEFCPCSFIFTTRPPSEARSASHVSFLNHLTVCVCRKVRANKDNDFMMADLWVLSLSQGTEQRCGSHGMVRVRAPIPGSALTQREVWTVWTLGPTSAGPHQPSPLPPIRRNILPRLAFHRSTNI